MHKGLPIRPGPGDIDPGVFQRASTHFLLNFMITPDFVEQVVSEDNRVAMQKINQAALSDIVVPAPPLAEQNRVVAKVNSLMLLCDQLEASLDVANTTRARFLENLLHEALDCGAEPETGT